MTQAKNTLMSQFIAVQKMQYEFDSLKKEQREISAKIRSLSHKMPEMIRLMDLK